MLKSEKGKDMDIMRMGKNPNYLGSWDLEEEPGKKITVTIAKIVDEEVAVAGQKEMCTVCHFSEAYKPMILNVTNKKRLAQLYKTKDTEKLIGKRVTVVIERVKAFGATWDALRFSKALPPANTAVAIKCEKCGNDVVPTGRMTSEQVAEYTKKKYGKCLCHICATALANEGGAKNDPDET